MTYLRLEPRTPEPYVTTSGLTRPYPPGNSWWKKFFFFFPTMQNKLINFCYSLRIFTVCSGSHFFVLQHIAKFETDKWQSLTHVVIPLEENRAMWSSKLIPPTPITSIWSAGLFKVLQLRKKAAGSGVFLITTRAFLNKLNDGNKWPYRQQKTTGNRVLLKPW